MLHSPAHLGHVNENRFALLDLRTSDKASDDLVLGELAQCLCSTRLVDDLLVLDRSDKADARYRIFGGDRREADFCCNGALFAISTLVQESGTPTVVLDTRLGLCHGACRVEGHELRLGPVEVASFRAAPWVERFLENEGLAILGMRRAGEPHVVVAAPPQRDGATLERHAFEMLCAPLCHAYDVEGGVNVTMVFVVEHTGTATIRTYERGVRRMTGSCGSGSLAAASVLFAEASAAYTIRSPGGAHEVWCEPNGGPWCLSAPTHHQIKLPLGKLLQLARDFVRTPHHPKPSRQADVHHGKKRRSSETALDTHWT